MAYRYQINQQVTQGFTPCFCGTMQGAHPSTLRHRLKPRETSMDWFIVDVPQQRDEFRIGVLNIVH